MNHMISMYVDMLALDSINDTTLKSSVGNILLESVIMVYIVGKTTLISDYTEKIAIVH